MDEFSILIGGKAGDGIDKAGLIIASMLNQLGYCIYIYREYPSIIRGGHTFSIIRASKKKIAAHTDSVDVVLAMNKETVERHSARLKPGSVLVCAPKAAVADKGRKVMPIDISAVIEEEEAPAVTANSVMVGAAAKILGIKWKAAEKALRRKLSKATDENLKVARRGFEAAEVVFLAADFDRKAQPLLTGNEALGLGLVEGGLDAYIAYPMTPASNILHFMAAEAENFGLKVVHPESEIGVILMALGCAYTGGRAAVGTSGGGFCLMTEGFSLAAMTELPVVIALAQRPGPSTGLPTYSSQTELDFALSAGHGEFARLVAAPGDAEEAWFWARTTLSAAVKHRIPAIILVDKNLGEGVYSFEQTMKTMSAVAAFVPERGKTFKVNSYEHDENGLTTEDPVVTKTMQNKRLVKIEKLAEDFDNPASIGLYGDLNSKTAVLCWGSNKGVCAETAQNLGLKVIQPIVMSPFPVEQFKKALSGVERLIAVENNALGQLAGLIEKYGFQADETILKYDGRAFSVEELESKLTAVVERKAA